MKKLINKLFEKLGYVPKGKYQDAETILHNINVMDDEIRHGVNEYQTFKTWNNVFVTAYSDALGRHRIIKVFPKGDTEDSADYARICAEELCDMLTRNIDTMEHKVLQSGTKVRVFAQRVEHHERTRSGWKAREEIRPERFGVVEKFMVEQNYPFYRVKFPDGSIAEVHPTQLEPYEWD